MLKRKIFINIKQKIVGPPLVGFFSDTDMLDMMPLAGLGECMVPQQGRVIGKGRIY